MLKTRTKNRGVSFPLKKKSKADLSPSEGSKLATEKLERGEFASALRSDKVLPKCSAEPTSFSTVTIQKRTAAFFVTCSSSTPSISGGGWLIFRLPPAEAALHPSDGDNSQAHGGRRLLGAVLYLMFDDLPALMKKLEAKSVSFSPPKTEDWGTKTTIKLPSGGEVGLYQPRHLTALNK